VHPGPRCHRTDPLKDALHATGRDRRVRLVSITGAAGIGKSRLAWEFEKYVDGVVEIIPWHRGRSPAYGEGIAFWALGEMVRRRAGLAENDDEASSRTAIAATVADYVDDPEDRRWVEPALLALIGLEPPPAGGRDARFAGWRIFFERISRRGPTVLLFEDLHWADPGLLDFVDHLVDWSKGAPILIITLARPELIERRPEWGVGKRHFTALALEPLSDELMRDLLERLGPGLPDDTITSILARADGIPLYAVETVRMLVADGRLERDGDAYRPVGDLTSLAVPETLRSLVAARLDVLDAADRRLLQDASVLGRTFTAEALAGISEGDPESLNARLRTLTRRELLELEADPRSPERGQYGFVQSLIREVAYDAALRAFEVLPAWASAVLPGAVRAALWERDAQRAADAAHRLDEIRYGDPLTIEVRVWAEAVVAALEGRRDDAVAAFRGAAAMVRELRLDFELARMAIDMLIALGPEDPEARSVADEARPILERLGARPYLDLLATALSGEPGSRAGRLATETASTSEPTIARPA
jgi:AAA ATPase-like protein